MAVDAASGDVAGVNDDYTDVDDDVGIDVDVVAPYFPINSIKIELNESVCERTSNVRNQQTIKKNFPCSQKKRRPYCSCSLFKKWKL